MHEAAACATVDHTKRLKDECEDESAKHEADDHEPIRRKGPWNAEALDADTANMAESHVLPLFKTGRKWQGESVQQHQPLQVKADKLPRNQGPVVR